MLLLVRAYFPTQRRCSTVSRWAMRRCTGTATEHVTHLSLASRLCPAAFASWRTCWQLWLLLGLQRSDRPALLAEQAQAQWRGLHVF